jgi:ribokinase
MSERGALFVGDASVDLTLTLPRLPEPDEKLIADAAYEAPGGVVSNAAVACLRAGGRAKLMVGVGDDFAGRFFVDRLNATGIIMRASVCDGETCRAVSLIEPHGEKRLILYPGVSMYPTVEQIMAEPLDGIEWVHTAVYDKARAQLLIDRCRGNAIPWSLDLEPATFTGGIDELSDCLNGAEFVFCNTRATAAIGRDAAGTLLAMGARAIIQTCGSEGAVLCVGDTRIAVDAPVSPVVDTTGAGDCLAGWFIAERLLGLAPIDALSDAVIAATMSCGWIGAADSYPTREDFQRRPVNGIQRGRLATRRVQDG